jgi:hypothetical protein
VRTTLTLDEDVANRLKAEMRRDGTSLKEVVNRLLRRGLEAKPARKRRFKVRARPLGQRAGVDYSKTSQMLDWLDGRG